MKKLNKSKVFALSMAFILGEIVLLESPILNKIFFATTLILWHHTDLFDKGEDLE